MMELLDTGLKAGGWTAAWAALLWFINQRLPKAISVQEEKDAAMDSMRETIEFQGGEIKKLQEEARVNRDEMRGLRKEIRESSTKAHKLLLAVHHCVMEYPETTTWWHDQLAKMEKEI